MEVAQQLPTPTVETITPEVAEEILKANLDNRKVRPATVDRYARDMQTGAWPITGEALKFSKDGTLIDGQHRLFACVQAGVPFQTLVIRGLEFESREVMDTGAKRTFADVLRWHSETQVTGLSAAIECGLCWDESGTPAHRGPTHTNHERLVWLGANPDIRDAVKSWTFAPAPTRFPLSAGAPFLMRARRISPELAEQFVQGFKTGEMLSANSPLLRLKTWCFNAGASKGRLGREDYAAIAVKAWNAFVQGREVKQLSWRRASTGRGEDFPLMLTPDGRTYEEIITDPNYVAPGLVSPQSHAGQVFPSYVQPIG